MKDALEELWGCISQHKDPGSELTAMFGAVHFVTGGIGTILLGALTPVGYWAIATFLFAILLFVVWLCAPDGGLAIGYFFAMHIFSAAWVLIAPFLTVICIICSPIIISEIIKANAGRNHNDNEK